MNGKRQKTRTEQQQLRLAFAAEGRDESPDDRGEGPVPDAVNSITESPTSSDRLMDRICNPFNFARAMAKVIRNGGAPGVDGMKVKELEEIGTRFGRQLLQAQKKAQRRSAGGLSESRSDPAVLALGPRLR